MICTDFAEYFDFLRMLRLNVINHLYFLNIIYGRKVSEGILVSCPKFVSFDFTIRKLTKIKIIK